MSLWQVQYGHTGNVIMYSDPQLLNMFNANKSAGAGRGRIHNASGGLLLSSRGLMGRRQDLECRHRGCSLLYKMEKKNPLSVNYGVVFLQLFTSISFKSQAETEV